MIMKKIQKILSAKINIAKKVIFSSLWNPPFPKKKFNSSGLAYILKNSWHQKIHKLLCNNFWPLTVSEKWTSEVLSQIFPAGKNFIIHLLPLVKFIIKDWFLKIDLVLNN